jgi:archaellum biogenesis ATPase FlaH
METTILKNLIYNGEFTRRAFPFLKGEYFSDPAERTVYSLVHLFIEKYKTQPTKEALVIDLGNETKIPQGIFDAALVLLNGMEKYTPSNMDWLITETEKFCQEKAVYNAVMNSIHILDGQDKKKTKNSIPEILIEALGVSFDVNVGHDYIDAAEERYEFYHKIERKISFDLEFFNKITKGGLSQKTLNIILAGTGVGKSLFMCHMSANCMMQHKNVLYITLEMAEERIAERIDANLLDLTIDDVQLLPLDIYQKKITELKKKTTGKLIIKEYPTATANVSHFRNLLDELNLKKKFVPDIIFIDYINICASSRFRATSSLGSYTYIKAIAEELRGLAVERNVPIMSATQTNRTGFANSDPDLTDTSESFGLPATADFMFALISNDQFDALNQIMVKQLKNRYNDWTQNKRFVVGIDRSKMKLFDATNQGVISDSGQSKSKKKKEKVFVDNSADDPLVGGLLKKKSADYSGLLVERE